MIRGRELSDQQRKWAGQMADTKGEDPDVLRLDAYRSVVRGVVVYPRTPLRICHGWFGSLWNWYRARAGSKGQVMKFHSTSLVNTVRLPVEIKLTCKSKVKKWAFENAWVLIVMAIGFAITWVYLIFKGVSESV